MCAARKLVTLRVRSEIDRLFQQGRRRRGRFMDIVAAPRPDAAQTRWLFVTSRKVGKAVVRNKVRRWLRECAREHARQMTRCWDIAVIGFTTAPEAGYWALLGEMETLLAAAGPLRAEKGQ